LFVPRQKHRSSVNSSLKGFDMGHSTQVCFRASEVKRAFKALADAGMRIDRVNIQDGKVEFIAAGQSIAAATEESGAIQTMIGE
jgi:hypothetical protein